MRYDTTVNLIGVIKTPDGLGGFTTVPTVLDTIQVHMTPVRVERMLRQYGLKASNAFRFVTQDTVPREITYFEVDTVKYKMIELLDYSRFNIVLVEEVA